MSAIMRLDQIYAKASKIRTESTDFQKEFTDKLKEDTILIASAIYEFLINEIAYKISRTEDSEEKYFIIWNIQKKLFIDDSLRKTNVKFRTFFTGFFDSKTKTFTKESWEKAGLDLMVDEVNKLFLGTGIYIEDVSDTTKSYAHLIKVTVPPKPAEPID